MGQTLRYCRTCQRETWQNDTVMGPSEQAGCVEQYYWCPGCQQTEIVTERENGAV